MKLLAEAGGDELQEMRAKHRSGSLHPTDSAALEFNRAKMEIELSAQAIRRGKTEAVIKVTINHLEQATQALRRITAVMQASDEVKQAEAKPVGHYIEQLRRAAG